jgi:hypothetical protein
MINKLEKLIVTIALWCVGAALLNAGGLTNPPNILNNNTRIPTDFPRIPNTGVKVSNFQYFDGCANEPVVANTIRYSITGRNTNRVHSIRAYQVSLIAGTPPILGEPIPILEAVRGQLRNPAVPSSQEFNLAGTFRVPLRPTGINHVTIVVQDASGTNLSNTQTRVPPTACDDSSPNITLKVQPNNLDLHYTNLGANGFRIPDGDFINTSQSFKVSPPSHNSPVILLFTATDEESGINFLSAEINFNLTCIASFVTSGRRPGVRDATANFSNRYDSPRDEVSRSQAVAVEFNYNQLWRRAGCDTWGIIDVSRGQMRNIRVTYSAKSQNNAKPNIPQKIIDGEFSVNDGFARE